jgi:hypothetical protein
VETVADDKVYHLGSDMSDLVIPVVLVCAAHKASEDTSFRVSKTKREHVLVAMTTKALILLWRASCRTRGLLLPVVSESRVLPSTLNWANGSSSDAEASAWRPDAGKTQRQKSPLRQALATARPQVPSCEPT